jgi:hypothetical protein
MKNYKGLQSYRCSSCDFDLCLDCVLKSGEFKPPKSIFGQIYLKIDILGLASYHFDEGHPYVDYSNTPDTWRLDN